MQSHQPANPSHATHIFCRAVRDRRSGSFDDRRLRLGLPLSDESLCLYRGALCLLVGETGAGKSSVATHWALSAAVRERQRVAYISTEDGADLFAARQASFFYGVDPQAFMFGDVPAWVPSQPEDMAGDYPLEFFSNLRSLDQVLGCMWQAYRRGVDLVVLDYVQALRPVQTDKSAPAIEGDRRSLIASAIGYIRDFCEKTGVACVVVSQARRMRESETLTLSHAKEAGELENACDVGVLLMAKMGDEAFAQHEGTHLKVAKHKLPVSRRPVFYQRDRSRGGCFSEVDASGRRTETPARWEDDRRQNPTRTVQHAGHQQGSGRLTLAYDADASACERFPNDR